MLKYLFVFVFAASLVMVQAQDEKMHRLSDVKWPRYDDDGNLLSLFTGDLAVMRPDGMINIEGMTMILYKDGAIETKITTPSCVFNRETMKADSEDSVLMEHKELILSGTGFSWDANIKRLEIRNDAKVILLNMDIVKEMERRK
ncbi:MAG: LPS export ABC transporter periplasmic protein LptC [Lentisphaerae bacterium]|nr:LPS export ABC transporter periplasmic protein LptC [Lentisphaerota bacterium]